MEHLKDLLFCALDCAAQLSSQHWGAQQQQHQKHERDFALNADLEIEQAVKQILASSGIPVLGEELAWQGEQNPECFWVVDPLDGTINYARELPLFGCCIALVQHGQAVLAGIDLPKLGERYWAIHGQGAYLNQQRIQISTIQQLSQSMAALGDFAVGPAAATRNQVRLALVKQLAPEVMRVRMFGSAAVQLAWLAAGRVEISLILSNNPWDVQAGVLIAREAGAHVFDADGSQHQLKSRYTLACVPAVQTELMALLNRGVFIC